MAQLVLPVFPRGSTHISITLVFEKFENTIYYYHGCAPIFSHAEDDLASFRMITSQFIANGNCKQVEVIRESELLVYRQSVLSEQ